VCEDGTPAAVGLCGLLRSSAPPLKERDDDARLADGAFSILHGCISLNREIAEFFLKERDSRFLCSRKMIMSYLRKVEMSYS
jgi:hypothetical protein